MAYKEHGCFIVKDGKFGWEDFSLELNRKNLKISVLVLGDNILAPLPGTKSGSWILKTMLH